MENDRPKILGIFIIIFIVLCGYYYFTQGRQNIQKQKEQQTLEQIQRDPDNSNGSSDSNSNDNSDDDSFGLYRVHVAGEVNNPGVYKLKSSACVGDAIKAAGGGTEYADYDRINLAENIKDGEKIRVPNIKDRLEKSSSTSTDAGESNLNTLEDIFSKYPSLKNYNISGETPKASQESEESAKSDDSLININTASVSELRELPGIGPTIADSIIKYRKEHNGFKTVEDLKNVTRIGDKTFEKIKDKITVK